MSQNFMQDGVTISVTVAANVTKIYAGTPVLISGGYAVPASVDTGADGICSATCAGVADPGNYITNVCTFRTSGVFAFAPASGVTLVLGDIAYIAAVDNATASPVEYEQIGARTTLNDPTTAGTGDVALGRIVGLGGGWGYGNTPAGYAQVLLATRQNDLADAS